MEMPDHLDYVAFAIPVAPGPHRGSSLVKLTHRDCLLAVAGLDLEGGGHSQLECSTLFCPVPLRTLLSGGTIIIIPKHEPASSNSVARANASPAPTLTAAPAAIPIDVTSRPSLPSSSLMMPTREMTPQTKPSNAKPVLTDALTREEQQEQQEQEEAKKTTSGTARAIRVKQKYDKHVERMHWAAQLLAPELSKQQSFNVDLNPLVDWSSSWVQPMQVPLAAFLTHDSAAKMNDPSEVTQAKAKEQRWRQDRAGRLPGKPVTTTSKTIRVGNGVKIAREVLADTSSHIGVIPAMPTSVAMHWDNTFSGADTGVLMRNGNCSLQRLVFADSAGCDAGFVKYADICRRTLASHPAVSAVRMFFDLTSVVSAAAAAAAAPGRTGSASVLWGAVVFEEGNQDTPLPSVTELLSYCPKPDPGNPSCSKYMLHGLVRWRQRGSLVQVGQACQSRL